MFINLVLYPLVFHTETVKNQILCEEKSEKLVILVLRRNFFHTRISKSGFLYEKITHETKNLALFYQNFHIEMSKSKFLCEKNRLKLAGFLRGDEPLRWVGSGKDRNEGRSRRRLTERGLWSAGRCSALLGSMLL